MVAPPQTVDAPVSPADRRYSILDAANGPFDLPAGRLADVQYEAPHCVGAEAMPVDCDSPGELLPGDGTTLVVGEAFTVSQALSCIAVGKPWPVMEAQTRAALEATEHIAVEEHVAGLLAASGAANAGAHATIVAAISALEVAAYVTARYGLRAVLHLPISMSAHAADAAQFVRTAPTWSTPLGTTAYFNGGLPDDTAYITGQVALWRGPVEVPGGERGSLDRITNEWKAFAQRSYAATFECFAAVATIEELIP